MAWHFRDPSEETLAGFVLAGHHVRMTEAETEAQFRQLFTRRVKDARESAGMKQWQIAELLGIPREKYKHYEGRSLLPHYLVGRFCMLCRVDPAWLMTGKKPLMPPS
jgi:DNA-binding transcriptional regulator YiaG